MAVCHSAETGWTKVDDLTRLSDLREEGGNLLWAEADINNLTIDDIQTIAEEFGLHRLAVEDALNARQRPKLEAYDNHTFVVVDQLDEADGQLEAAQIACFVGDRYVLTVHAGADRTLDIAKERWQVAQKQLGQGAPYLVHTLLDVIVDDYQRIADDLEDEVEQLEDVVLNAPGAPIQRQLYSLRQRLARMRRFALPAGRVLETLTDGAQTPREASALYRDVRDHLLRINDQIRNIDDLSQAVLDLSRSEQANSLNEVTKKLTGWAAIIAVPTFIASVYGMNFHLVPADGEVLGFWFALSLMALSSIGLYVQLKKRGWI